MGSSTDAAVTPATDLVSVVIPAFQAERTLGATLRSVLDQTHRDIEVLVVDDGSTDGTADLIRRAAADERVVPVSYGGNRGRSFARNAGIDRSTGRLGVLRGRGRPARSGPTRAAGLGRS